MNWRRLNNMKLTIDSICLISSILDKIKIDDKVINDMFLIGKEAKGKEKQDIDMIKNKIGMNIMLKLGSKLHEVRDELVKFVAVYKEITEDEAAKVDMIEIIKELISDEDFTSFLKRMAVPKQKK